MVDRNLSLRSLLEALRWQKIQRHFSEVLGLTIATVDLNGNYVTDASKPTWLTEDAFRFCVFALNQCRRMMQPRLKEHEDHWREGVKCPLGFYYYFIPMKIFPETAGYILAGPVLLIRRPESPAIEREVESLGVGIDPETVREALGMLKVFTFTNIKSVVELLYDIASSLLEMAYKDIHISDSIFDTPDLHRILYTRYVDKVMRALMEVTVQFTNAERASIMLYDSHRRELSIRMAKGIPQEVIENTRVRLGEGVSGLVAKRRRSIVINESLKDRYVKKHLHIPEIKSALSLPIQIEEKLIGVLNVATFQPAKARFFTRSLPVVDSFIKLAQTTLQDFVVHSA